MVQQQWRLLPAAVPHPRLARLYVCGLPGSTCLFGDSIELWGGGGEVKSSRFCWPTMRTAWPAPSQVCVLDQQCFAVRVVVC